MHHLDDMKYAVNRILEIELSPVIKATSILKLPGRSYHSFCFSGDSIYAFHSSKAQLELLIK